MKHRRWLKSIGWGGMVLLVASCEGPATEVAGKTQALVQGSSADGEEPTPPPSSCQQEPGGYLLSDVTSDPVQGFIQTGPTSSRFGSALAAAGDTNSDGLADILVGAPANSTNRGSVFLYQSDSNNVLTQFRRFDGEAGAQAGSAVALGGDGRLYTAGTAYNTNTGRVYGTPVSSTNTNLGAALVRLTGSTPPASRVGAAIATQGNLVGTSALDLAVGAPTYQNVGAVYVLAGLVTNSPTSGTDSINTASRYQVRIQGTPNSEFGRSIITADINGDGRDDLIVGAPGQGNGAGAVFAFFGPLGTPKELPLSNAVRFDGAPGSRAGSALVRVPDLNGDGIDEILVGAPEEGSATGRAYLISGSGTFSTTQALSTFPSFSGENPGDRAGSALSAGDVNADGHPDLLIGAPGYGGGAGAAYLVYGSENPLPVETGLGGQVRYEGSAGDEAGASVLIAGDMNGDGAGDLLIGAPGNAGNAGAAYLVYGTLLRVYHRDADGDGFGSLTDTIDACTQPPGYLLDDTDCNDGKASISPAAEELCNDIDDNCNGDIDTDAASPPRWAEDADRDNHANPFNVVDQCKAPSTGHWIPYLDTSPIECGASLAEANASDQDNSIHMGAPEICDLKDNNCDSQIDDKESTWYVDADHDGYGNPNFQPLLRGCNDQPAGYVQNKDDCNDANAAINPNTPWYRDADNDTFGTGADIQRACTPPAGYVANADDCDDSTDAIKNGLPWYRDEDGDGHGFIYDIMRSCTAPSGYVALADDCDDKNGAIHPGQAEVCDYKDNNCNGTADEGVTNSYYPDVDRDGFGTGDENYVRVGCTLPPGYSINNLDCNDLNPAFNPNTAWYRDADGDGYGNVSMLTRSCTQPSGYVLNGADCDDNDRDFPNGRYWHRDADNDGHGNPNVRVYTCAPPNGYVASNDDCNDTRAIIYTGAPEVCDNFDNDCDGDVDEGVLLTFYADADGDGYGNMNPNFDRQACTRPGGYVTNREDCNDLDRNINPNTIWYADADGDQHANPAVTQVSCTQPPGYLLTPKDDCNDNDGNTYPGAIEHCEAGGPAQQVDNDCDVDHDVNDIPPNDPTAPLWWGDNDNDGYAKDSFAVRSCLAPTKPNHDPAVDGTNPNIFGNYMPAGGIQDCDDSRADTYPGAPEICDNRDNNCNNAVDEGAQTTYYFDADGDNCGDPNNSITGCAFCLNTASGQWVTTSGSGCR